MKCNRQATLKTSNAPPTAWAGSAGTFAHHLPYTFVMFGNIKDAGMVLLNVPFAIIGLIAALLATAPTSAYRPVLALLRCLNMYLKRSNSNTGG
jgi:hypothetical protein